MKKLILLISSLAIITGVSAQDFSKREIRKEAREKRQTQFEDQLGAAIQAANFTFYAYEVTPPYKMPISLAQGNFYISLYGNNNMDTYLPFTTQVAPAIGVVGLSESSVFIGPMMDKVKFFMLNLDVQQYTYSAKLQDGYWHVTIGLQNVNNQIVSQNPSEVTITLTITLDISASTGATNMTIQPLFSPAVQYQGTVRTN